jgi:3-oxoadipate enol-lactonase
MAVRLHYEVHGPEGAPVLLLSNSLGTSAELWDAQLPAFQRSFRVVRYDTRGHGRSEAPPGPYTLDELGQDALSVLDAVGAERAHVCGISIGGLTALWLGLHAPQRVGRLVAANTSARVGTAELWNERMRRARSEGLTVLAEEAMARWFTPAFRERRPEVVEGLRRQLAACPVEGYAGCCAALRDADLTGALGGITSPTLIVAGAHDPATPAAAGERLRQIIPGAQLVTLECAHLSNVEAAPAFTSAVTAFLSA